MPYPPVPSIPNTWGVALVGQLFSTMLTGVELVQVWIYCWNYWNKDKKTFKFFLVFLMCVVCLVRACPSGNIFVIRVVDILSTATGSYSFYWFLVLNYGNFQAFGYRLWSIGLQTILNSIPGPAVQLYYTRRVYLVSESMIFPIIVVPLILAANITEFYLNVKAITLKEDSKNHTPLWLATLCLCGNVLVDILITLTMSWTLYRKRTGFARTDSMIKTLMAYTINSGIILSALGAAVIISFSVSPTTFYYVAFLVVMTKCYLNFLLAMLNRRDYVRDRSTMQDNTYNLTSIRLSDPHGSKSSQTGVTVTVHRSTTSDRVQSEPDHNSGPTFEVPKPPRAIHYVGVSC